MFVDSIIVLDCRLSGIVLLLLHTVTLSKLLHATKSGFLTIIKGPYYLRSELQ